MIPLPKRFSFFADILDKHGKPITPYIFIVTGLFLVLFLSIGCNSAIQRYRQREHNINTGVIGNINQHVGNNRNEQRRDNIQFFYRERNNDIPMHGQLHVTMNIHDEPPLHDQYYEDVDNESSIQHNNQRDLPLNISADIDSRSTNSANSYLQVVAENNAQSYNVVLNDLNKSTNGQGIVIFQKDTHISNIERKGSPQQYMSLQFSNKDHAKDYSTTNPTDFDIASVLLQKTTIPTKRASCP